MIRIGLIVNPIAGMGGAVGLHGTDGSALSQAHSRGATEVAAKRARRCIDSLASCPTPYALMVGPGAMGEAIAIEAGLRGEVIGTVRMPTTAADTQKVAREMVGREADLIVFAGGDGTAIDLVEVVGTATPILGIPTGVKMHSSVFATSPEAAGSVLAAFVDGDDVPLVQREVLDIDDARELSVFVVATVPYRHRAIQRRKAASRVGSAHDVDRLCANIARGIQEDELVVVGPGTTTNRILDHLGSREVTPYGVKLIERRIVTNTDASEDEILSAIARSSRSQLILGVIGGQGFLLGRGNQQLSPAVVSAVGEENVTILASEEKIATLDPPVLFVDAGVDSPAAVLGGYQRVYTSPRKSRVMKVVE